MRVENFYAKKEANSKISMVTCYDYSSARILSNTSIDCLLVGDSLAMTMHGFKDTLSTTLEMMVLHTAAVKRGANNKFIVSDLPFLSYRKSLSNSVSSVQHLICAGANAVKLEGASGNLKLIKHLVDSGIPVMGHIGLTPQHVLKMGYKVQGRTQESRQQIQDEALLLQEAGCFALVLECIPSQLAKEITEQVSIATIGIGAGPHPNGQVLVFQDLLGLNIDFTPSFVKKFTDGEQHIKDGVNSYIQSINRGEFPLHEDHCCA
ncbi:MAG: 3-methyl-2-oxobutanoate hydroxymethyltransferase [Gammaproteobacteria bacterium]|nr:3-methyl-2-oxobutanoate hydroxymethyltransferase [Gammaproteobacteria bacterium]